MIQYISGDLFAAVANDSHKKILIPHVCNNIGAFGSGFVIPLGKTYPKARQSYFAIPKKNGKLPIGTTDFVTVSDNISVANMIAQNGIGGTRPLRYNALSKCLDEVAEYAINNEMEIYSPLFGSGLAGGNWLFIEEMIKDAWLEREIKVTVFYLLNNIPANWIPPQ